MLSFPQNPVIDQTFPDPPIPCTPLWKWDGTAWKRPCDGAPSGGAAIEVSPIEPDDPSPDMLWFNETDGHLYLRLQDAWVQVGSDRAGPPGPRGVEGPPGPPGEGMPMGVTNISNAAPGQVGQVISVYDGINLGATASWGTQIIGSIALTPGDWMLSCWFSCTCNWSSAPTPTLSLFKLYFAGPNLFDQFITTISYGTPPALIGSMGFFATSGQIAGSIGPVRVNTAVPRTITIQSNHNGAPAGAINSYIGYELNAVRIR